MKRILSLSVAGTAVIAFLAASLNQPVRELTSRELAAIRGGAPFDGCATNCDCAVDCQYDASTDTCTRCKAPAGGAGSSFHRKYLRRKYVCVAGAA